MAKVQSTSNSPNSQPVTAASLALNLTPASEGLGPHPPYVSSTRASVDSDSDYQQINNATGSSVGSQPVSRSSTYSALSTTATKDGIEGKRVHRIHDPLGYSMWMYAGGANPMGPPDSPSDTLVDREESSINESLEGTHGSSIAGQGSELGSNDQFISEEDDGCRQEKRHDDDGHDDDGGDDEDDELDHDITPPNIPSAPPITLSEKIRLLRTGSVSGIPPYTHGLQQYEIESTHSGDSERAMDEMMFEQRMETEDGDEEEGSLTE